MSPEPRISFGFGRFAVDLPPESKLRGRQQAIAHLPITAAALAPRETLGTIVDRVQGEKRLLPPPPGVRAVVHSAGALLPDLWVIIFHDDPDTPESIAMEAVRVTGATAFWIRGGNTVDRVAAMEDAALRIGGAIVPSLDPNPPQPGFCIDRGVVAMPFHYQESAEAFFGVGEGATLSLESHSNGDRLPQPLLQKHAVALPRLASVGVPVVTRRAGPRELAGLAGEEVVLISPVGRGAAMQWAYVGRERSAEHPSLSIGMELREGVDPEPALATWDALLASLRRRSDA